MYDTIWNISLVFILTIAFIVLIFLCLLPLITYSKFLRKRKTHYSFLLLLYPITLTILGKHLVKMSKTLYHQDLDFRIENDLSTHILSLDGGLNHLVTGYFLQISSYPIYIIVTLILIVRLIESKKPFSDIWLFILDSHKTTFYYKKQLQRC